MKTFAVTGRYLAAPPPAGWREHLAQMLGAKPRRIGTWAELGMYGALYCMADAGENTLPQGAQLWLGSRRGTYAATEAVLEQLREDLPMPLAFLQTQPSQLLAMLAARLEWTGHACFVAGGEPEGLLRLAAAQAGGAGILLGWVDEMDGGSTNWLRLVPEAGTAEGLRPLERGRYFVPGLNRVQVGKDGLHASGQGAAFLGD